MADIQFDRSTLTSPPTRPPKPGLPKTGLVAVLLLFLVAGLLGYKMITGMPVAPANNTNQKLDQIRRQLSILEARLNRLERREHVSAAKSLRNPEAPTGSSSPAKALVPMKEQIRPASAVQPASEVKRAPLAAAADMPSIQPNSAAHQEWQATAERLTDVAGTVGSQQMEISSTRREVRELKSQVQHFAVAVQLRRNAKPQVAGPVWLKLKSSDPRHQRYSISVLLNDRSVEFKDRAVDEVIDFVVPGQSAPIQFVATKIEHNSITGYMEIPTREVPR